MTTQTEALNLAISRLEWFIDSYPHDITTSKEDFLRPFKEALAQPEQEPVAWLQFRDNKPPVVAPRDLGTPVFLGIRGGLAHDAGEKP